MRVYREILSGASLEAERDETAGDLILRIDKDSERAMSIRIPLNDVNNVLDDVARVSLGKLPQNNQEQRRPSNG